MPSGILFIFALRLYKNEIQVKFNFGYFPQIPGGVMPPFAPNWYQIHGFRLITFERLQGVHSYYRIHGFQLITFEHLHGSIHEECCWYSNTVGPHYNPFIGSHLIGPCYYKVTLYWGFIYIKMLKWLEMGAIQQLQCIQTRVTLTCVI